MAPALHEQWGGRACSASHAETRRIGEGSFPLLKGTLPIAVW